MALVGMAITVVGTNASLSGPLAFAMRTMGYALASPVTVADADLSALENSALDEFFDRAELRLLQNIKGNIVLVDIQVGPRRESLGQLAVTLKDDIDAKAALIASSYGNANSLEAGVIGLNFMQTNDEDE